MLNRKLLELLDEIVEGVKNGEKSTILKLDVYSFVESLPRKLDTMQYITAFTDKVFIFNVVNLAVGRNGSLQDPESISTWWWEDDTILCVGGEAFYKFKENPPEDVFSITLKDAFELEHEEISNRELEKELITKAIEIQMSRFEEDE